MTTGGTHAAQTGRTWRRPHDGLHDPPLDLRGAGRLLKGAALVALRADVIKQAPGHRHNLPQERGGHGGAARVNTGLPRCWPAVAAPFRREPFPPFKRRCANMSYTCVGPCFRRLRGRLMASVSPARPTSVRRCITRSASHQGSHALAPFTLLSTQTNAAFRIATALSLKPKDVAAAIADGLAVAAAVVPTTASVSGAGSPSFGPLIHPCFSLCARTGFLNLALPDEYLAAGVSDIASHGVATPKSACLWPPHCYIVSNSVSLCVL